MGYFSAAADQLMDRELDDDIREEIKQIILSHPQVLDCMICARAAPVCPVLCNAILNWTGR